MIPSVLVHRSPQARLPELLTNAAPITPTRSAVKIGRILEESGGGFGLEYDNTRGQKYSMRLDALTYDGAVREARSFLEIAPDDRDADGDPWAVE